MVLVQRHLAITRQNNKAKKLRQGKQGKRKKGAGNGSAMGDSY
jgi:hypothetical protein